MIVGKLADYGRIRNLHPGLDKGFQFLQGEGLPQLADGRHEIDGERLFAIISRGFGRGQAESPLEYHRRYADIQYVIRGIDSIGWQPTADCQHEQAAFDAERDLGFFRDRPATWLSLPAGSWAVFFPEDAHAPLGGTGPLQKVVVKVWLDA